MSHEKSFSFDSEGRHFLAPTVINGKEFPIDEIVKQVLVGKLRPLAQASTQPDIERMAKERSNPTRQK